MQVVKLCQGYLISGNNKTTHEKKWHILLQLVNME